MVIVGSDDDDKDEKRRKSLRLSLSPADASSTGPDGFSRRRSASSVP